MERERGGWVVVPRPSRVIPKIKRIKRYRALIKVRIVSLLGTFSNEEDLDLELEGTSHKITLRAEGGDPASLRSRTSCCWSDEDISSYFTHFHKDVS